MLVKSLSLRIAMHALELMAQHVFNISIKGQAKIAGLPLHSSARCMSLLQEAQTIVGGCSYPLKASAYYMSSREHSLQVLHGSFRWVNSPCLPPLRASILCFVSRVTAHTADKWPRGHSEPETSQNLRLSPTLAYHKSRFPSDVCVCRLAATASLALLSSWRRHGTAFSR